MTVSGGSHRKAALFVDLYELTMGEGYLTEGLAGRPATFQLYVRHLPPRWGYLVAAGLHEALQLLEGYLFAPEDVERLASIDLFGDAFLERLAELRFTGDVRALPEGTVFFPDEPVLEVTAPLLEAQLVETLLLNALHYDSLVAAKASRCVTAAAGRRLVEFGARRAHGRDAAVRAARASYLAGFDSTSNVLAGLRFGIPLSGTMAHSFVECFAREADAFAAFAGTRPEGATLLIDTYDTLEGARRAARVADEVERAGGRVAAVRLDSGDLAELSNGVRAILDEAGRPEVRIFASGGLDEDELARLVAAGAPIDGFGVGIAPGDRRRRAVGRHGVQARRAGRPPGAEALGGEGDDALPEAGLAHLARWVVRRGRDRACGRAGAVGRDTTVARGRDARGRALSRGAARDGAGSARHAACGAPRGRALPRRGALPHLVLGAPRRRTCQSRAPSRRPRGRVSRLVQTCASSSSSGTAARWLTYAQPVLSFHSGEGTLTQAGEASLGRSAARTCSTASCRALAWVGRAKPRVWPGDGCHRTHSAPRL